jgi:hypothetical protein
MKGLDPQPRPSRRVSWSAWAWLFFVLGVSSIVAGLCWLTGWYIHRLGGPAWLTAVAAVTVGQVSWRLLLRYVKRRD